MDDYPSIVNLTKIGELKSGIENQTHFQLRSEILGTLTGILLVYILNLNSKNKQAKKFTTTLFIAYAIVTLILMSTLLAVLTIFSIYRACIYVLLKIKYKSKFKNLLNGPDAFWQLKDDSNSHITILLIIKYKSANDIYTTLLDHLNIKLFERNNYEKLFCKTGKFLGYSYLLKNDYDLRKYLTVMNYERYSSESALKSTLDELASTDLEGNLWEILVGNEEISFGNKTGNPIFVRFNHCLGDGVCLLQILLTCFTDVVVVDDDVVEKDEFMQTSVKISIYCMHFILVLYNLPSLIFERLTKKADRNVIHGPRLSGRKVLAWKTEDFGKYVRMVKTIKKEFYVGFFDVVATALAAALTEFLNQYKDNSVDVTSVVPALPNVLRFKDFNHIKRNLEISNSFSVGLLDLPLRKLNLEKYSTRERFQQVKRRVFALKKSLEYQVNYWLLNIVATLIPEQLLHPLLNSTQSTLVISNLPGPRKLSVLKENSLEDIVFWIPHRGLTGVGITFFTYDNRFQIGISIDEVYGISRENIEKLLDDIFKHLSNLEREACPL